MNKSCRIATGVNPVDCEYLIYFISNIYKTLILLNLNFKINYKSLKLKMDENKIDKNYTSSYMLN